MRPRRGRDDRLDDQHSRVRRHSAPDGGKDFDGFRVGPVVDDVHQQVSVGFGHSVSEEIAADHLEFFAIFRRDLRHHVRLIEEDSLCLR